MRYLNDDLKNPAIQSNNQRNIKSRNSTKFSKS